VGAEEVRRVTVATNTMGAVQCGFDATGAPKTAPASANAAKFSIPFTVAAAIARRRVTLAEFTDAALRDPALRELAGRVETRVDPAKDALPMLYPPVDVAIETTGGRVLAGCEEYVKGDPRDPFTLGDCVERFMTWAASAARPLPADDLERFVSMVERLEDVEDAAALMPRLGGAAGGPGEEPRP
jgi:2-methylcitrate dehydratase PrpD